MDSPIRGRQSNVKRVCSTPIQMKSSISAKSTQSAQIVLTSQQHFIEHYGHHVPVYVKEVLTFNNETNLLSARLSPAGYAWLVCSRRLLVWQFANMAGSRAKKPEQSLLNPCHELKLPQSDLVHRSELIYVFELKRTATTTTTAAAVLSIACVAVSPEGQIRFWPSIAHDELVVETAIDLNGQECECLIAIGELGFMLATTTCTVCILQPVFESGKYSIRCQSLRSSSGWLSGFGKLFSSLMSTNGSPFNSNDVKLVRMVSEPIENGVWNVLLLAGYSLQKWQIEANQPYRELFDFPLQQIVLDNFYLNVWTNSSVNMADCDCWILDIHEENQFDIVLLVAAAAATTAAPPSPTTVPAAAAAAHQQLYYALMFVRMSETQQTIQTKMFHLLKIDQLLPPLPPPPHPTTVVDRTPKCLGDRFQFRLLKTTGECFVFNRQSILSVKPLLDGDSLVPHAFESDFMDLSAIGNDEILCGCVYRDSAVFFTKNHGPVIVSNFDLNLRNDVNRTVADKTLDFDNDRLLIDDMFVNEMSPDVVASDRKPLSLLKASFLYFLRNQLHLSKDTLAEFMPSNYVFGVDSILDTSVLALSEEILNAIPASDPRWSGELFTPGFGSSLSTLQIPQQLENKQKLHRLFVQYLQTIELWPKLSTVRLRTLQTCTVSVLCEHWEKLAAARVFNLVHANRNDSDSLLDEIIDTIAADANTYKLLTKRDLFYCRVGRIDCGLRALVDYENRTVHSSLPIAQIATLVDSLSAIFLNVLKEVQQARAYWIRLFLNQKQSVEFKVENLPWTASSASDEGIKNALLKQIEIIKNYGLKYAMNDEQKMQFFERLVRLIDTVLDGEKVHCDSLRTVRNDYVDSLMKHFEDHRFELIHSLVEYDQYEQAIGLAEKYQDFNILIEICDKTDNKQRLHDYMDRFEHEGFPKAVFNWHLKEHKQEKLLNDCRTVSRIRSDSRTKPELLKCLAEHPTLSWVQFVFDENYCEAACELRKIASREYADVRKRKNLLSLAKLCVLVMDTANDSLAEDIETNLVLIDYQENLPVHVLEQLGIVTVSGDGGGDVKQPFLNPGEIINVIVCPENDQSTEADFKEALELLQFIGDENDRAELSLKIWTAAILKDRWDHDCVDNDPIEIIRTKFFFQLINLCEILGSEKDPFGQLPKLQLLLDGSNELNELKTNPNFEYLMKIGYEFVESQLRTSS